MGLNKYSHQSDQIADLYRAAFYMAKGSRKVSLGFLKKSLSDKFEDLMTNPNKYLTNKRSRLYWAEKILDEYERRKSGL